MSVGRGLSGDAEPDRPADAARRALRAARERAAQETTGPQGAVEAGARETRPGDAARAALRGGPTRAGGPAAQAGTADAAHPEPGEVPAARTGTGDRKGGRPADVAREALRAARGEARRARSDAEMPASEATRRPVRPVPPVSGHDPHDRSPGDRRRDLRELLAGSFELPTDNSPAGPAITAAPARSPEPLDDESARTDPSPPVTVGDVLRAVAAPILRDAGAGAETPAAPGVSPGAPWDTGNTRSTWNTLGNAADRPSAANTAKPRNAGSTAGFRRTGPPVEAPVTTTRLASPTSSMAAPGRDGELRRTFPTFPALPASANGQTSSRGDGFAESWWGNAWVAALEEGALDAARLLRGRGYAAKGHVDAITVTPGLVLAYVQGSRPRPYRVQVRLRTLGDQEWERFLEAAVERPGHIAALLDKEMPQSLADCGAPLLPGPGDLDPLCSCPDSGHPCKHAAALCYQTARLLDADPFVLLLLRGRGEREVLDELSRRNAARAARAAQEQQPGSFPGVRASEALVPRVLPPLPAPL
ncbi:SWIM zinc finger family protein, partial [Streptomyces graminilatus]|uniref:SWIM zinc finger family protein n=1 Tax=Streptomyces graminilatus TaxID=1464070 RepID=UPI00099F0888